MSLASAACGSSAGVDDTSQTGAPPTIGSSAADAGAADADAREPMPPTTGTDGAVNDPPRELCGPGGLELDPDPIARFVVGPSDVGRRLVYSWTSPEQIAELRADPTLLTRSITADGYRGRAADWLAARADTDDIAAIVAAPAFANKRFGWANPWATLLGAQGETYGTELLAIELREEALIGRADVQTGQWAFFDVDGAPVSLDTVRQNPERIAAVYFLDAQPEAGCFNTLWGDGALREYVVCNEAMVASWSAYTAELLGELEADLAALRALRDAVLAADCGVDGVSASCWAEDAVALWQQTPTSTLERYAAALALPAPSYMPTLDNLEALIAALEAALFDPDPLVHTYP